MLSWGATAAAGLVWLLCALRNGRTLWQASRGRESGSPILLLGGLFGAMAVVARADATLAFGGLMTFISLALLLAWINRKALQTGSPAAPGLPAG